MSSLMRTFIRVPRTRLLPTFAAQPARFAHGSYGNQQSGQEQGTHEKNPMEHLEHPGPEAPSVGGQDQSKSQSSPASKSSDSSSSSTPSSGDAQPKINTPKSAAEEHDPEVKKHNEEMAQRSEKSVNQLSEEDNKVDKKFWKGDVGDMSDKKKSES